MRKEFIAGNWKMNMDIASARGFASDFLKIYDPGEALVAVAAPFTQLAALKEAFAGSPVMVFAQNMHYEDSGAFTGEISAPMLRELGVDGVIIGHSERRQYFGETDEAVLLKTKKALSEGLIPIVCVGESLEERDGGQHLIKVGSQVAGLFAGLDAEDAIKVIIAYEPIWAIGTGRTATAAQAEEMCSFIRGTVAGIHGEEAAEQVLIQYGGSVKPSNAAQLMAMDDIDGALVGGASLKPADLAAIIMHQ